MARFSYMKGDSPLHKMDPTWKFLWNFLVVLAVIVNFNILYAALWYIYIFILIVFVARIPFKMYIRGISFFMGIAFFIFLWVVMYFPEGNQVIFEWGPIRTTMEGILHGISLVFRVMVIVSLSVLFAMTTDPARLVESMIQVGRVPYRIGYTAYASMRFIPIYENEAQVITNAHLIRGVGEAGKSFKSKLKLYWSLLVPLLVSGIRRAQIASIAMDSRGFGAYSKRTIMREIKVSTATKAFVLVHLAITVAAFYYYIILGHGIQHLG
jgi:energy-coupling factor transport system permease protein